MADAQPTEPLCINPYDGQPIDRGTLLSLLRRNHVKLMRVFDALLDDDTLTAEDVADKIEMEQSRVRSKLFKLRTLGLAKSEGKGRRGEPLEWSRT